MDIIAGAIALVLAVFLQVWYVFDGCFADSEHYTYKERFFLVLDYTGVMSVLIPYMTLGGRMMTGTGMLLCGLILIVLPMIGKVKVYPLISGVLLVLSGVMIYKDVPGWIIAVFIILMLSINFQHYIHVQNIFVQKANTNG